ncbi:MAG: hypothetical protein MHM6MM_008413 [Cercozoa sp. M6MM]
MVLRWQRVTRRVDTAMRAPTPHEQHTGLWREQEVLPGTVAPLQTLLPFGGAVCAFVRHEGDRTWRLSDEYDTAGDGAHVVLVHVSLDEDAAAESDGADSSSDGLLPIDLSSSSDSSSDDGDIDTSDHEHDGVGTDDDQTADVVINRSSPVSPDDPPVPPSPSVFAAPHSGVAVTPRAAAAWLQVCEIPEVVLPPSHTQLASLKEKVRQKEEELAKLKARVALAVTDNGGGSVETGSGKSDSSVIGRVITEPEARPEPAAGLQTTAVTAMDMVFLWACPPVEQQNAHPAAPGSRRVVVAPSGIEPLAATAPYWRER